MTYSDESAKIGASLRIRIPQGYAVHQANNETIEQPLTIADYAERVLTPAEVTRQAMRLWNDMYAARSLGIKWPVYPPLTRWQRIRRPFIEAKSRLSNAWLALKGYQIDQDDY